MNTKSQILSLALALTTTLSGFQPIWAEGELPDNLDTTTRLIARLNTVKDLAVENFKSVAPDPVEKAVDNCLAIVKQLVVKNQKNLDFLAQSLSIISAPPKSKAPLISPLTSLKEPID